MTLVDLLNSEAVVAVIGGVFAVITAAFTTLLARQHKAIKAVREDTTVAREQTANTHSTNLREDIDRVIALSERLIVGQDRHTEDLATLRTDIAWERRERMDLAARLTKHIDA